MSQETRTFYKCDRCRKEMPRPTNDLASITLPYPEPLEDCRRKYVSFSLKYDSVWIPGNETGARFMPREDSAEWSFQLCPSCMNDARRVAIQAMQRMLNGEVVE